MNDRVQPWRAPLSRYGSALVALDDERAALATTLILQEMGLTVDIASDHDGALDWIEAAHYEVIICAGREQEATTDFVLRARYLSRDSRVILLAEPEFVHDGLEQLGIEVLQAPIDVNQLVARVWPKAA